MKDFVGTFSPSIDIQIKFSGVAALKFHMDTSNYHICKEEHLQMFSSHFVGIGSQARIVLVVLLCFEKHLLNIHPRKLTWNLKMNP